MLEGVALVRELYQFPGAPDGLLGFTLCAGPSGCSPGYLQQHAARLGFVAGVIPGRMVIPAAVVGLPPILSLTFYTQAAMADDPALSAIPQFLPSPEWPQNPRWDPPF